MLAGIFDGFPRNVDAHDFAGRAPQFSRAIPGSAARIEHAPPACHTRRKCVAGHVLIQQVRVDLARNDPFAREFRQGDAPLARPRGRR